jgi:polyisoprenoid-binding protein YceI
MDDKIKWGVDPAHSEVTFKVKHMMVSNVSGRFTEFDGSIYTTNEDFTTAEVDFWVNPASINTGNEDRDKHLKSPDFFDVENHKEINISLNTIETVDGDGSYDLYADLTINGIKKQVKMGAEFGGVMKDPWGNHKAGITISGKINRKDFGLNWNAALEAGGVLVGNDVSLHIELQLVKQS